MDFGFLHARLIAHAQGLGERRNLRDRTATGAHRLDVERRDTHRQMADVHVKMAECLASDKQISECQKQMSGSCSAMGDMMGKG